MTKQFFVMALILVSMIGAGAVGSVAAEPPASPPAGGVPQLGEQILQAIQNLQNTVNTLQQTVRTLQTQVGQISTNPQTSYYLTKGTFAGDQILSPPAATPACDPGFHFASFLEIIDVTISSTTRRAVGPATIQVAARPFLPMAGYAPAGGPAKPRSAGPGHPTAPGILAKQTAS